MKEQRLKYDITYFLRVQTVGNFPRLFNHDWTYKSACNCGATKSPYKSEI